MIQAVDVYITLCLFISSNIELTIDC